MSNQQRLEELQSFNILDKDIADELSGLTNLASTICETPISLINLLDAHHQITKSSLGTDMSAIPRKNSFCHYTIEQQDIMLIEDTKRDKQFKDKRCTQKNPDVRFYAGVPLTTMNGFNLGTLCVIDNKPRKLSAPQLQGLKRLGKEVIARFDLLKKKHQLEERNSELKKSDRFLNNSSDIQVIIDADTLRIQEVNNKAFEVLDWTQDDLLGQPFGSKIIDEPTKQRILNFLQQSQQTKKTFIARVHTSTGQEKHLELAFSLHDNEWYVTARDISDRKQAFRDLEKTQIKKNTILNSASDCIITINHRGEITQFNRAAEKTFQYTKEEVIGKRMSETLIPKHHRKAHINGIHRYLKGGNGRNRDQLMEMPALRKDGTEFPVELQVSHIEGSTPPQFLGILRDISERKKNQEKLRKTLTNLNLGQELARVGSWQWDVTNNSMEWSKKIYDIYNLDITLEPSLELLLSKVHPQDQYQVKRILANIKNGKLITSFEHRLLTSSGNVKWVRHSVKIRYDHDSTPKELSGAVQNITKQKITHFKLEREKKLSDNIINSLPIAFFMFDYKGKLIRWNNQIQEVTGYSKEEIASIHPRKFVANKHRNFARKALKNIVDEEEIMAEADLQTKAGHTVPHLFSLTSFKNNDRTYFIGTAQDISDLKKYEQQLEVSLNEKKVLLSEIHHRVKNNLAIISGLLQLECFNTDDTNTKHILANSQLRIQSMSTVHEMLYQEQDFSNLSFEHFIGKNIEAIQDIYEQYKSDITFNVTTNNIQLNVNQAIPCGLIINEILTYVYNHAFPNNEGEITIKLTENNNEVSLHIKDNGQGLPKELSVDQDDSLGFSLINSLACQLEANIEIDTTESGPEFIITFEKQDIRGAGSTLRLR